MYNIKIIPSTNTMSENGGKAILYDALDGWNQASVLTPQLRDIILRASEEGLQPIRKDLLSFCPLTPESSSALMAQFAGDGWGFQDAVQAIINHMSNSVPTVHLDGVHGTGKTYIVQAIAEELSKEGIAVGKTKYTGFIEDDEINLYTNLEPWQEEIRRINDLRNSQDYKNNISNPHPAELSWHVLKQHWLTQLNTLYTKERKIILAERGVISRIQSWSKDNHNKMLDPFSVNVDLPYLNAELGKKHDLYGNYFQVGLPLPYTIYLYTNQENLDSRLSEGNQKKRIEANQRNFERFNGLAWDIGTLLEFSGFLEAVNVGSNSITDVTKIVKQRMANPNNMQVNNYSRMEYEFNEL